MESVHLVLSLVRGDPDRVDGADEDTRQRQENTQHAGLLSLRMMRRFRFIVGDNEHPQTHGCKRIGCISRNGFLVEEEIDEGDHWREEDTGYLVEGDGGVGEGEVLEDDVEAHCRCQGEHEAEAHGRGDEEGDDRSREEVEGQGCDEEVEACKGDLGFAEGRVVEDGFVGEDLKACVSGSES